MSHHFDNPNARDDPRLNINDFYLFSGGAGRTAMAMTVNPDAGLSAPETLREEGLYAFRFDLNGDDREELTFKFRFGAPFHAPGRDDAHAQAYEVRKARGGDAAGGLGGELIAAGRTGEIVDGGGGVLAFVGLAPDLFAGDGVALNRFKSAFHERGEFAPEAFENRQNGFEKRNVTAIVLETPTAMIGAGGIRAWATSSLHGHAPETQVCRWGWPLFTHVFLRPDERLSEAYNRGVPADDFAAFGPRVVDVTTRMVTLARSAPDPAAHAAARAAKLLPSVLPYELGTPAAFALAAVNGRGLGDDVMDVILAQVTNIAIADGVEPDKTRIRPDFPYFGRPFSGEEQAGVKPAVARKSAEG
jgi:hypothetical protein